jgi:hypothetical protein
LWATGDDDGSDALSGGCVNDAPEKPADLLCGWRGFGSSGRADRQDHCNQQHGQECMDGQLLRPHL